MLRVSGFQGVAFQVSVDVGSRASKSLNNTVVKVCGESPSRDLEVRP